MRDCLSSSLAKGLASGVSIARPFVGAAGSFQAHGEPARLRAAAVRRDAAGSREGCRRSGVAIGKIEDLFAGRGITRAIHTASDDEGMDHVDESDGRDRPRA